jgi:long-chain acyl-CoA synthetase
MSPDDHARAHPDRAAAMMARAGSVVSYRTLVARSRRVARFLRQHKLASGDSIALLLKNQAEVFDFAWAAQRLGLYYTLVNWHLTSNEIAYIVGDCGARLFVADAPLAAALPDLPVDFTVGSAPGVRPLAPMLEVLDDGPLDGETEGQHMLYSAGTTGRPKGVKRALRNVPFGTPSWMDGLLRDRYGLDGSSVFLCLAPLYHAAPFGWSMAVQRFGGTIVVMESFDAAEALRMIERHHVTHVFMAPIHFVRLLKLDEATRRAHDLSSLRCVVHAAAPCPVEVKERMLDWLGPVIHEYYSSTEGLGFTTISPQEWRSHPGSVGKALNCRVVITDDAGHEMPAGQVGTIRFEGGPRFSYHNDAAKTASVYDAAGRATVGDIGYLDADGYLYLTDRHAHTIISGGVNIYPQEVENVLALHPALSDVAVFGVPNDEYGEEVKAVVVAAENEQPGPELAERVIAFCRERLAHFKCPRTVDFVNELPRSETGKLLKRVLRDRYVAR